MTPEYGWEIVQAVRSVRPETIVNSRLMYHGNQIEGLDNVQLDGLRDIGVDYLSYRDRGIPDHPAPSWGRAWEDTGLGVKKGITMGQALRGAGYATFAVGKWHLDGNPVERGFDHYFGHRHARASNRRPRTKCRISWVRSG